jgi:hypothetical protein
VLRGIDAAFDKYEARQKRGRMRRINGLAWCAQAVMEAAEELREAAAGTATAPAASRESGFEQERVAAHLDSAAVALDAATSLPKPAPQPPSACANWPPKPAPLLLRKASRPWQPPQFMIELRLTTWKPWSAPSPSSKRSSLPP